MDYSKKLKYIILFFIFLFIILISNNCHAFSFTFNNRDYTLNTMGGNVPLKTYTILWGGFYKPNSTETEFYLYSSDSPLFFKRNSVGDISVQRNGSSQVYYNPVRISSVSNTAYNITNAQNSTYFWLNGYPNNQYPTNAVLQQWLQYCDFTLVVREADNSTENVIYAPYPTYNEFPYFLNSDEDIAIGFQSLVVMPGEFPNSENIILTLEENSPEEIGAGNIQDVWSTKFSLTLNSSSPYYIAIDDSGVGFYYSIPWDFLGTYLNVSEEYRYTLSYSYQGSNTIGQTVRFFYGGSTNTDAIYNSLQQQIQHNQESIDELNSTITDDTITSNSSDLPSNNTNDITRDGINTIFQSIYNAFCTGQAQDIVFPIPFTNKTITLSPYYVRDNLNNNGGSWVYSFIQIFWGYVIGRYIVKDVMNKINKIKSGDIEHVETSNIKGDML